MSYTADLLKMIGRVNWTETPRHAAENELVYATTYLRLFAGYVKLNHAAQSGSIHPFSNPSKLLGVSGSMLDAKSLEHCEGLASQSLNAYDAVYLRNALEWAALCDAQHPATDGYENLFAPLVKLVASRVSAIVRQGNWVVGDNIFPLHNWVERYANL